MSADLDDGPERSFASRLKRRRGRENAGAVAGESLPVEGDWEFGYGGWNVTVAPMGGSAVPVPQVGPELPPQPRRGGEEPLRPAPEPAVDERLLPRRPEARRRAASLPEPPPSPPLPPPPEDRPIIAPAPPRRRTMPEAPSRVDGPRLGPRERNDSDGARHRRTQRILGGGTVMIDDELYPLVDWSAGGIAIRSEGHLYRIGDRRLLELEIDLDDYAVNLDLDGEVVNRSSDRTGWRFTTPTETQRQVLRALTQASTSGGGAAAFPRRADAGGKVPPLVGAARPRRRASVIGAIASLPFNAVVILAAVGIAVYAINDGRLPEIDLDRLAAALPAAEPEPEVDAVDARPLTAAHAAVAVERIALAAPAGGIVLEWAVGPGEAVAEGEPLVSLAVGEGDTARAEAVLSPCDCILSSVLAAAGQSVAAGAELALLYRSGVEADVHALFAPGSAPNPGDPVTVTLTYTGEVHDGVVTRVGRQDAPDAFIGLPGTVFADNPLDVFAVVRTAPGLPPALAGDPAQVTVRPRS
jgi:hypothetical protein